MIRTPRLLLRRWRDEDLDPFAAMNADPRVAEHLPGTMSRDASDAMASRIRASWERNGFDAFAVEVPGVAPFIGFVGCTIPRVALPFGPCVEVGWRLAADHWGRGYATEAARACLEFGFTELALAEIVSFTVPANVRSRAVMERIGMARDIAGDFEHPGLPEGHAQRPHVLYRLSRDGWNSAAGRTRR